MTPRYCVSSSLGALTKRGVVVAAGFVLGSTECRSAVQHGHDVVGSSQSSFPRRELGMSDEAQLAKLAFEGVFPPAWRKAESWRVKMNTEIPSPAMYGRRPPYGDVEFEIVVVDVPSEPDGFYRLDAIGLGEDTDLRYAIYYRKRPFSFARIQELDRAGLTTRAAHVPDERPAPAEPHLYNRGRPTRFIDDFPMMPNPPYLGLRTFSDGGASLTQRVETIEQGLRFIVAYGDQCAVVEWHRGDPWWTKLERTIPRPTPLPAENDGNGVLLR